MHVWLKIVAIGTIHGCFRQNSCNWPILYTFQLKDLQLAQTMRISVEIVVISSECVYLAQTIRITVEVIVIGSDNMFIS